MCWELIQFISKTLKICNRFMTFLQISRNRGEAVSERRHRLQDSRTSGRRKETERRRLILIQSVVFDVGFRGVRWPGEIISNLEKQQNNSKLKLANSIFLWYNIFREVKYFLNCFRTEIPCHAALVLTVLAGNATRRTTSRSSSGAWTTRINSEDWRDRKLNFRSSQKRWVTLSRFASRVDRNPSLS